MSSAAERAHALELEMLRARCREIRPFDRGHACFHDGLSDVWQLNFLSIERAEDLEAGEVEALADRLMGHLEHRKVVLGDADGQRLAEPLRAAGWSAERQAVMARPPGPAGTPALHVDEVDFEELAPAIKQVFVESLPQPEHVADHLVEARRARTALGLTRWFRVRLDGESAAYLSVHRSGGTAEIDDVSTLERFRRRGAARALMLHAIAEAGDADTLFLIASADDWPSGFYERLGFEEVASRWEFVKTS